MAIATGKVLKDALLATIQPAAQELQSLSAHAKTPEYRERVLKAFTFIFDTCSRWSKETGKWSYGLTTRDIAFATDYSDVMVGYYRTLWEASGKSVTTVVAPQITPGQPLPRDDDGNFIIPEPEEVTVKVSDALLTMDIAELARAVRKDAKGEQPELSSRKKGENAAKRILNMEKGEQAQYLQGFAHAFTSKGSSLLLDTVTAVHQKATRGKVAKETVRLQEATGGRS